MGCTEDILSEPGREVLLANRREVAGLLAASARSGVFMGHPADPVAQATWVPAASTLHWTAPVTSRPSSTARSS
jgi:hypothetical protein